MPTYTQVWDHLKNAISTDVIYREDDQAWIPADTGNKDWQEYLLWLDEGNRPGPPTNMPTGETTDE